ncbi:MAG TPA: hypothetical protein VMT55_01910, partial [Candidatus Sulfotelmatobacter sp.]|nr:hypothetical protein [Candidatus Sulfotelmatobacter sp.]
MFAAREKVCVILLALLIYFPVIFFGYTYHDDVRLIIDNQAFLRAGGIPAAFQHDVFRYPHGPDIYYRPILTLSLMLDARFSGTRPYLYHGTNLALHILAALLLFHWLLRLGYRKESVFLGVLIFTAHPAIAQAVAWIPGRNDTLLAVFALISLLFYQRYGQSGKITDYLGQLLFFFCALFTKESAVLLVAIYLLLDRTKLRYLVPGWLAAIAGWAILRQLAMVHPAKIQCLAIFNNLPALLLYLGKVFFPVNLSVLPLLADTTLLYGWLALSIIVVALYFSREKSPGRIVLGLVWY